MQRYRFAVEYLGTGFDGWQVQPGRRTVEGELAKAFAIALKTPVDVVGSGRTDAGVHALGQVAHFDFPQALDIRKTEKSINALTPADICIRRLEPCGADFHARFSALSRRYQYAIALRPTALYNSLAWYSGFPVDVSLFAEELAQVVGRRNFANFCISRLDGKSEECEIFLAKCEKEGDFLSVRLEANRFLHKMVRAIVGACFEVARGHFQPGTVRAILNNEFHGEWQWVPPTGLCLEKVIYQDYDI